VIAQVIGCFEIDIVGFNINEISTPIAITAKINRIPSDTDCRFWEIWIPDGMIILYQLIIGKPDLG
jgi:hypothetical protein